MTVKHSQHDHHHPAPDAIEEQAAEWLVRQEAANWNASQQQALEQWLNQSPRHASTYRRVEKTWRALGQLVHAPELYDSGLGQLPQPPLSPPLHLAAPRQRLHRAWLAGTAVLLLSVTAALTIPHGAQNPIIAWQADHRTQPGETRTIALPDGSSAELDGNSAIAVHYSSTQRHVTLLHGQAWFHPRPVTQEAGTQARRSPQPATPADHAPPEHRPFIVTAQQGSTRALGTQFIVEQTNRGVQVTGLEHQVRVSVSEPAHITPVTLSPGQTVRYQADGIGPVTSANPAFAQAWRHGSLIFDRDELQDVVATLNRHSQRRIILRGDESLAQRPFSGVFPADAPEKIIPVVVRELNLKSLDTPLGTFIYR